MKDMLRTIIVLSVLCALSGFILSYLKTATAPVIEMQLLTNVQGPALASVFSKAENDPIADRKEFDFEGRKVVVFPSIIGGKLSGVAIEAFGSGYGGDLGVLSGFNTANDTLAGVGMTQLKETPGLGMRVKEPAFSTQFKGSKAPVALSSKGGSIDAISGATISSTAVVDAVNAAYAIYQKLKPEFAKIWQ
ncbi:MAG: FMN-binding protein [Mailhella sp.]|nr:FMN-binding protein [Mailhella sp.]